MYLGILLHAFQYVSKYTYHPEQVKKYTKQAEKEAQEILVDHVDQETRELILYQIKTKGKRIRPQLAIMSCLLCGGNPEHVVKAAAGIEILHTYTQSLPQYARYQ